MVTHPGNDSLRVLVVDDHAISRRYAIAALRQCASAVKQAASGEAGICIALSWQPDVVLLDRRLPDLDGREVARRIRSNWPADRKPPRIVLLSAAPPSREESPTDAGLVDLCLAKPAAPARLQQAVLGPGKHADHHGYPTGLRELCRNELRTRLRELDRCLHRPDYAAASHVVHLMIAASAYGHERRMELALRRLQQALQQPATTAIAAAYYSVRVGAEHALG